MISNQILQTTIEGIKEISRVDFCVSDTDAKVLASTFQLLDAKGCFSSYPTPIPIIRHQHKHTKTLYQSAHFHNLNDYIIF